MFFLFFLIDNLSTQIAKYLFGKRGVGTTLNNISVRSKLCNHPYNIPDKYVVVPNKSFLYVHYIPGTALFKNQRH